MFLKHGKVYEIPPKNIHKFCQMLMRWQKIINGQQAKKRVLAEFLYFCIYPQHTVFRDRGKTQITKSARRNTHVVFYTME